jgi:polysaccharide chain length determinant protein (PEP-CTERM system associated)
MNQWEHPLTSAVSKKGDDSNFESSSSFATKPQFLPLSIARMLWKQRAVILLFWLVVTALTAAYVFRLPNVYEGEAVLLVDSQKIPEKFVASTVEVTLEDSLNAISEQVLSTRLLEKIVDKYHLYQGLASTKTKPEMVDKLRHDLTIGVERGLSLGRPGAFRISYDAPNPVTAAGVVNDVCNLFVTQNSKTREKRAEGTSEFIESQLQQAKKALDQQESQLSQYKLKWSGELPQQEAALMGALSRLQAELQGNQDAVARAQQNKLVLDNTLKFSESSLATIEQALKSPSARNSTGLGIVIPQSASDRLRAKLQELSQRYTDDHPEVRQVRIELAQALADEAKNGPTAAPDKTTAGTPANDPSLAQLRAEADRQRERVSSTKTQLQVVDQEIKARNLEREQIRQAIVDYQNRVEKLPIREQQLAALTRDYETEKVNYNSLLEKKHSAEMASEMEHSQQSERFTIAEPARVPVAPIKPKRPLLFGMGSIAGLALGLVLALAIELKKDVFLGEWEVPKELAVLGRVSLSERPASRWAAIGLLTFTLANHIWRNLV